MLTKQQEMGQERAAKARADYLANPQICRYCQQIILPKPGEKIKAVRRRLFCSRSCAGSFNNAQAPKRKRKRQGCQLCGMSIAHLDRNRHLCEVCLVEEQNRVASRTKGDTSRRNLYAHATSVMRSRERKCQRCGYALFVDVCHIKAIKSFPAIAPLSEVNDPGNLVYLCPNCHHELDAGLLALKVSNSSSRA